MRKQVGMVLGLLVALALLLAACAPAVAPPPAAAPKKPAEPIKVGFIAPLTGDVASYGQSEKNVTILAVEEINQAGGIDGRPLEVIYEDGKCSGKDAATAARKLIDIDKVKIILGGACSGETLAVAPIAEQEKVILFSAFSSSPDVTKAGDYVFRNSPSDNDAGKADAKVIIKTHKRVGILSENTDYAQGVRRVFKEEFPKVGGQVVADELHAPDAKDFRTQLLKIKEAGPEALFLNPQSGLAGGLAVKQARELGIAMPIYSHTVFSGKDALTAAGAAAEGVVFVDYPALTATSRGSSLLKKYKDRFGSGPESEYEIGSRYDSAYILAEAIKKVGLDTEKIKTHLYGLKAYDGVLGKYGFDENGDVIGIEWTVKVVKEGKPVQYQQ